MSRDQRSVRWRPSLVPSRISGARTPGSGGTTETEAEAQGRIVVSPRRSAALSARARQLTPQAPEREGVAPVLASFASACARSRRAIGPRRARRCPHARRRRRGPAPRRPHAPPRSARSRRPRAARTAQPRRPAHAGRRGLRQQHAPQRPALPAPSRPRRRRRRPPAGRQGAAHDGGAPGEGAAQGRAAGPCQALRLPRPAEGHVGRGRARPPAPAQPRRHPHAGRRVLRPADAPQRPPLPARVRPPGRRRRRLARRRHAASRRRAGGRAGTARRGAAARRRHRGRADRRPCAVRP